MKKTNLIFGALFAAIPLVSLLFLTVGCEAESATQTDIQISPRYSEVSRGRASVLLSASGWSDYRWSLGDTSIGYLSSSVGDSVVYTATKFPDSILSNTFEQVVSVTADVPGTGGTPDTGTNTTTTATSRTAGIYTGTARIVHK